MIGREGYTGLGWSGASDNFDDTISSAIYGSMRGFKGLKGLKALKGMNGDWADDE